MEPFLDLPRLAQVIYPRLRLSIQNVTARSIQLGFTPHASTPPIALLPPDRRGGGPAPAAPGVDARERAGMRIGIGRSGAHADAQHTRPHKTNIQHGPYSWRRRSIPSIGSTTITPPSSSSRCCARCETPCNIPHTRPRFVHETSSTNTYMRFIHPHPLPGPRRRLGQAGAPPDQGGPLPRSGPVVAAGRVRTPPRRPCAAPGQSVAARVPRLPRRQPRAGFGPPPRHNAGGLPRLGTGCMCV